MEYVEELLKILLYHCALKFWGYVHKKFESNKNVSTNLEVLHRSNNFIVLNKRYDVVINSNDPDVKGSLHQELCQTFPSLANPKLRHGFYFVHRLDYATSGVICVALHKKACSAATSAFEERLTKKYYLALLRGHVAQEIIDITVAIGEDSDEMNGSHRMCTSKEKNCVLPRTAHTRLVVLERGLFCYYPATKVLLQPITGRRHQLRVHCSHLGHTIVGDFTYSRRKDTLPYRTFLHSFRLVLPNKVECLDIRTPDPFTPDKLNSQWIPVETVNILSDNIVDKLNSNEDVTEISQ